MLVAALIGAVVSGLVGLTIFFDKREPFKRRIVLATTIKGELTGMLTRALPPSGAARWPARPIGGGLGAAFGLGIWLVKGGGEGKDAPDVIPGLGGTGAIAGVLILLAT